MQPTPVLLSGKSHGRRSLVGYSPWGSKELDTTEQLYLLGPKWPWAVFHKGQTVGSGPIPGNPHPFPKTAGILLLLISLCNYPPLSILTAGYPAASWASLAFRDGPHSWVLPEEPFFPSTMAHSWIPSCTKPRTYTWWLSIPGTQMWPSSCPHTSPPATVTGIWWTAMTHQAVHLWQVYFSVCVLYLHKQVGFFFN